MTDSEVVCDADDDADELADDQDLLVTALEDSTAYRFDTVDLDRLHAAFWLKGSMPGINGD